MFSLQAMCTAYADYAPLPKDCKSDFPLASLPTIRHNRTE